MRDPDGIGGHGNLYSTGANSSSSGSLKITGGTGRYKPTPTAAADSTASSTARPTLHRPDHRETLVLDRMGHPDYPVASSCLDLSRPYGNWISREDLLGAHAACEVSGGVGRSLRKIMVAAAPRSPVRSRGATATPNPRTP